MSKVLDIAIEPPILLKPYMRIGEVIPKLGEAKIRVAPVVDDSNKLIGVLSYRTILSKGIGRATKVSTVMDPPYAINANESIDRAIASAVSWRARDIPIVNETSEVIGYINRFLILKYLAENSLIPSDNVSNIMSSPVISIQEWESIARARWLMIKNAFSRLPVLDSNEKIVGVITLSDIVERLYKIKLSRRKGYEWINSEESFLAAPVGEFMSSPPITVLADSSILNVVEIMLKRGVSGLPVVTENNKVIGIISGIDILKRYVERFATIYPIEVSMGRINKEDIIIKTQVERIIGDYLSSFSRYTKVIDFKISVKEIKKTETYLSKDVRRGFQVSAKLVTSIGSITAKTLCWDLPTCVREVMNIIEKRLRKQIDKRIVFRSSYRKYEEQF